MDTPEAEHRVDTVESVDSVDAPAPRRPATLVNLASDGCKYGVGEIAIEESNRIADRRTIHVFCNRPRVSSRPYCAEHEQLCRSNERSLTGPLRRPLTGLNEIRDPLKAEHANACNGQG